jgi:hypothetical protein
MNGVAFSMTNGTLKPVSVLSLFPVWHSGKIPEVTYT